MFGYMFGPFWWWWWCIKFLPLMDFGSTKVIGFTFYPMDLHWISEMAHATLWQFGVLMSAATWPDITVYRRQYKYCKDIRRIFTGEKTTNRYPPWNGTNKIGNLHNSFLATRETGKLKCVVVTFQDASPCTHPLSSSSCIKVNILISSWTFTTILKTHQTFEKYKVSESVLHCKSIQNYRKSIQIH